MESKFFKSALEFRRGLDKHHDQARELWVVYGKKGRGVENMTWSESVDEALCFG